MTIQDFAENFATIITRSPVGPGRPVKWTIIANFSAGGFTIKKRWADHAATVQSYAQAARALPVRSGGAEPSETAREMGGSQFGPLGVVPTLRPRHAGDIVQALLDEVAAETARGQAACLHLLVTAGGDGTSLEALSTLYHANPVLRSRFLVLRLPMGTGNDGADARELPQALDLLVKPSHIEFTPAVTLSTSTPGKGPFIAFNILSLGLDAFVTHMTNKVKGTMPGDSYKLWVDLATVFYDRLYHVGNMNVTPYNLAGKQEAAFTGQQLLLAFGASGHRTYGSNQKVLPDDRNVCTVEQMTLFQKLALKPKLLSGQHAGLKKVRIFSAARVDINYDQKILAQMDGESVLLLPKDFPVTLALTEPAIPVIRLTD